MEGILKAKYILLYACAVALYVVQIDGRSCSRYTDCDKCIRNACVWCNENSADYGNRTRCMEESDSLASGCRDLNKAKPSTYVVDKAKKESILSPQNVRLFLEYGSPMTIPVEIRIPGDIRQQSTLIMKYFEQRATYKQIVSMENGPKSRTSKKGRKSIIKIKNLVAGSTIKMNVTLETTKCRAIKHKTKIVTRLVQKIRKPKKYRFTILLRGNCPCSCQEHEESSVKCSGRGWYGCGICHCDDGYTGPSCEVDAQPDRLCIYPGLNFVCSGRGNCVSGICECYPINPPVYENQIQQRHTGRYCECNDYSCLYGANNKICSGNGRCRCGVCQCDAGFTGSDCDCPMSQNTCMASNGEICNGRGVCECGVCNCETGYMGPTCEVNAQRDGMCMDPSSNVVCNGRGNCVSGMCECNRINPRRQQWYSGRFCECSDYSCPYGANNRICSGNGRCTCGECRCNDDFTGIDCGCPKSPNSCMASNGELCNDRGICECGICNCDTGYTGSVCELDSRTSIMCKEPDSNVVCSGRGNCVSGMCECYPINPPVYENQVQQRYTGRYCECNDYSCPYGANNKICSGNGRCMCGECQCDAGFTGSMCDCSTSQNTCLALNGMICYGVGVCECGTCRCNPDTYYRGPTCEECPTCPGRCYGLGPCVECVAFGSGELDRRQCNARCYGNSTILSVVDELKEPNKRCVFTDDDGCSFRFSYKLVDSGNGVVTKVDIQSAKECPPE